MKKLEITNEIKELDIKLKKIAKVLDVLFDNTPSDPDVGFMLSAIQMNGSGDAIASFITNLNPETSAEFLKSLIEKLEDENVH